MYESFKDLHPISPRRLSMEPRTFKTEYCQPNYYEGACWVPSLYAAPGDKEYFGALVAAEYTGWRDESLATHLTCAITTTLNPLKLLRVSGPDAVAFLKRNMVNNFDRFPVGTTKHGIVVRENGKIAATGVLMRTGEESFELFAFMPILIARHSQQAAEFPDMVMEDISDTRFGFQVMGPKSLEVLEHAFCCDLHDIEFCHYKDIEVNGHWVRILRFGMHGGLGYEVHGERPYAEEIHKAIVDAGSPYGIRLLGWDAFSLSHTPGGSEQFFLHYDIDYGDVPWEFFTMTPEMNQMSVGWSGSAADADKYATPYDVGLQGVINYGHDFIGREALLKIREGWDKKRVTLKWNKEDVVDVYASQFDPTEEPYKQMDRPGQGSVRENLILCELDWVLDAEGNRVATSSGRTFSPYHGAMLSLATLPAELAEPGTEVYILWGDEGCRQKKIRATVERYPYNQNCVNRTFDTSTVPRLGD